MSEIISFVLSVAADVAAHCICKWLDRRGFLLLLVIPYERMVLSFVILLYAARAKKSSGQRKELQRKNAALS